MDTILHRFFQDFSSSKCSISNDRLQSIIGNENFSGSLLDKLYSIYFWDYLSLIK